MTQDGADPHHKDPLAHLQVTMPTFPRVYRALHQLAEETCDGRWVALGGGGYHTDVVPRAWAMLFAEMTGTELGAAGAGGLARAPQSSAAGSA